MYQQRNRGGFRGRNRSFSSSRPRSFGGGGRGRNQPKTLNPILFVRPAVKLEAQEVKIENSFADFNLPQQIQENVAKLGFSTPTPIQDRSLKPMLEGRDVIGLADTGTGKTAAFVLPILTKLATNPQQNALIVAPTRELAVQIRDDIRALSAGMPVHTALLIGGSGLFRQIQDLRRNPQIFIGTPGRLKDLHERRALRLDNTKTVVLDEMDRMLDMGFVKEITQLLSFLPKERQTLLFSATIDERVEKIGLSFMTNPIKVSAKTGPSAQNVDQNIIRVADKSKKVTVLHDLLRQEAFAKVIIFGRTKHGVEKLSETLIRSGFAAGSIHGNKRQSQRERILREFKENRIKILIATDVAARGIDVKDITHVINFDAPESYEDYVHRIGRTGRAGKTGIALTFVE